MQKSPPSSIDEYIQAYPVDIQTRLQAMRSAIHAAAPEAQEKISYQMPTFYLNGNLVHFAAHKEHIGFYPAPQGVDEFRDELARFKGGKGSVQFPHDQPLPLDLVTRIVKFRAGQNRARLSERKDRNKQGSIN